MEGLTKEPREMLDDATRSVSRLPNILLALVDRPACSIPLPVKTSVAPLVTVGKMSSSSASSSDDRVPICVLFVSWLDPERSLNGSASFCGILEGGTYVAEGAPARLESGCRPS